MKLKLVVGVVSSLMLSSCASVGDLSKLRAVYSDKKMQQKIQQSNQQRVQLMDQQDTRTIYSKRIECLSPFLAEYNSRGVDHSYINSYAFNLKEQKDKESILQQGIRQLEEQKNELRRMRIQFAKLQEKTKNIMNVKNNTNTTLTEKELTKLATDLVNLKELEERIVILNNQIQQHEATLNGFKENRASFTGSKTMKDIENFRQGNTLVSYAVNPIYDKTGKVYSPDSTALSELVAHALSYNSAVKYKDTPFNFDWSWSRAKYTNPGGQLSLGNLVNADRYITGALVQYDEGLPVTDKALMENIRISIDPVSFDKRVKVITVGIVLRTINSNTGEMLLKGYNHIEPLYNENRDAANIKFKNFESISPSSVYIQNTFFVKQIGSSMFEIISKRNYGGSISIETSDPKTYAIREMVERGVYELLLRSLPEKEFNESIGQELNVGLYSEAKKTCDTL